MGLIGSKEILTQQQLLQKNSAFLHQAIDSAKARISQQQVSRLIDYVTSNRRPSGTTALVMGSEVQRIVDQQLKNAGVSKKARRLVKVYPDYKGSGTTLVRIGERKRLGIFERKLPSTVGIAHMDEIGSTVAGPLEGQTNQYELKPIHADRLHEGVQLPAEIYRYNGKSLEQIGKGTVTKNKNLTLHADFPYDPADYSRIVYNPLGDESPVTRTKKDGDRIQGVMDNSAGVAAALAAVVPLAELAGKGQFRRNGVAIAFTDEEEGPPTDEAFSRGAERFVNLFYKDRKDRGEITYIDLDGGDFNRGKEIPKQPFYTTVVSQGKGPVMPAGMQYNLRSLSAFVKNYGGPDTVFDTTLQAAVSRSNPTGLLHAGVAQQQIVTMDYGVIEPHHSDGKPSEVSLENVTNAAQAFVITLSADAKGLVADTPQKRRR